MNPKRLSRSNRWVFGLVAVLCLIGSGATAVRAGECEDRIKTVQDDVGIVNFVTPDPTKTRASLGAKLTDAVTKLQEGKNVDAKQKLQDFKDAVVLMRDAPRKKISEREASLLLNGGEGRNAYDDGVNGAISCVCLLP